MPALSDYLHSPAWWITGCGPCRSAQHRGPFPCQRDGSVGKTQISARSSSRTAGKRQRGAQLIAAVPACRRRSSHLGWIPGAVGEDDPVLCSSGFCVPVSSLLAVFWSDEGPTHVLFHGAFSHSG